MDKVKVNIHRADPARADTVAVKNPDNMLVVNKVVVSSVAKKERERWTTKKMISARVAQEVRIAAARIASLS